MNEIPPATEKKYKFTSAVFGQEGSIDLIIYDWNIIDKNSRYLFPYVKLFIQAAHRHYFLFR